MCWTESKLKIFGAKSEHSLFPAPGIARGVFYPTTQNVLSGSKNRGKVRAMERKSSDLAPIYFSLCLMLFLTLLCGYEHRATKARYLQWWLHRIVDNDNRRCTCSNTHAFISLNQINFDCYADYFSNIYGLRGVAMILISKVKVVIATTQKLISFRDLDIERARVCLYDCSWYDSTSQIQINFYWWRGTFQMLGVAVESKTKKTIIAEEPHSTLNEMKHFPCVYSNEFVFCNICVDSRALRLFYN